MSKMDVRSKFKVRVFERDKYTCRKCGASGTLQTLDAHHITDRNEMPNGGYVVENGITLCKGQCHFDAERYHMSEGKIWVEGYHPLDLYELIGSTYDKAFEASERLK